MRLIAALIAATAALQARAQSKPFAALAYGQYRAGQYPGGPSPSDEQLRSDLRILKVITDKVRIYALGDLGVRTVNICAELGIDVDVGVYLSGDTGSNDSQLADLKALVDRKLSVIKAYVVGSEMVYTKQLTWAQTYVYVKEAKEYVLAAGQSVPVTFAEVYPSYFDSRDDPDMLQLTDYVDFIMFNIFPNYEARDISGAAARVAEVYQAVSEFFSDKEIRIGETGWPDAGETLTQSPQGVDLGQASVPSKANSRTFLDGVAALPFFGQVTYFEAFDEEWKANTEGTLGAHYGLLDANRKVKSQFVSFFDSYGLTDDIEAAGSGSDGTPATAPTGTTNAPTARTTPRPTAAETNAPTKAATSRPTAATPDTTEAPTPAATTRAPVATPATEAPVAASTNKPVTAATNAPVAAATNAPVAASTSAPVAAATNAPIPASTSAPVTPATGAPVAASTGAPVAAAGTGAPVQAGTPDAAVTAAPVAGSSPSPSPPAATAAPTPADTASMGNGDGGYVSDYFLGVNYTTAGLPKSCSAIKTCPGLDGACCPTPDGVYLSCCFEAQRQAVLTQNFTNPSCSAYDHCEGLAGPDCCPTSTGVILNCCYAG